MIVAERSRDDDGVGGIELSTDLDAQKGSLTRFRGLSTGMSKKNGYQKVYHASTPIFRCVA